MKTYFIFGLARSGSATALFLHRKNCPVLVFDDDPLKQQQALALGLKVGIPSGKKEWDEIEAFILSPGIPHNFPKPHPIVTQALEHGVRPICDIQLFFNLFPETQAIGITGSNGKSTSCMLTEHLLKKHHVPSMVAGNIGTPIFSLECLLFKEKNPNGFFILELSSYQLELIHHVPLKAAALLNVCEHHLHRYQSIKTYIAAKIRIFKHTKTGIIGPNPMVGVLSCVKSKRHIRPLPPQPFIPGMPLRTKHDQENFRVCQALLKTLDLDVTMEECADFKGLPHRQEVIATSRSGITFVNDSKATNPMAVTKALEAFSPQNTKSSDLLWIAGGALEEDHLDTYNSALPFVTKAFLIGASEIRYARHLSFQGVDFQLCNTLTAAFYAAVEHAKKYCKSATILLSPGCSSFDQFLNFEKRGEQFFDLVMAFIAQEHAHAFRI